MCGIVGFNWKEERLVKTLSPLLRHRGPDQSGHFCDERVSLGHRRLSILDLSVRGVQPMANEDGAIQIVFNGEIFNYQELREELANKGHRFVSQADTEVLVHLYEELGSRMLERLNGQFAFCIYDKRKGILFLARDRVGILPLFYYYADGKFIFASELKAIMRAGIPKEIDPQALARYIRFGYIAAPDCIIRNVYKLKPAQYMIFDLARSKIVQNEEYWNIGFTDTVRDSNSAAQRLDELLADSVRLRLIADVPVGAFLSGGIDSSAIVALIKRYKEKLKTFSIKFDYADFDESRYAQVVADKFHTEHHEITFTAQDVRTLITELPFYYDEPLGDPSVIPTYLVSKVARQHVTVALSGDGGDELLAGYDRYVYFFIARTLNRLPRWIKALLRWLFGCMMRIRPLFEFERIKEMLSEERLDDLRLYERLSQKLSLSDMRQLMGQDVAFSDTTRDIATKAGLDAIQHYDIRYYLEGDILAKVDRAAMAHSLETRPPFLDHRFMEFSFALTRQLKLRGATGKVILRRAFEGILPKVILARPKKGFGVPLKYYLRNELRDLVEHYVFNYTKHHFFNRDFLRQMDSIAGARDTTRLYWYIMVFNMWHEKWIASDG